MRVAMYLLSYLFTATGAVVAFKAGVVIPLALACLILIVLFPFSAWRGKLSVPIYALLALASGALAFGAGILAGARAVRGTAFGTLVSILFFLLVAIAVGCFFGMLFYRPPRDDSEPTAAGDIGRPSAGSPDTPDR